MMVVVVRHPGASGTGGAPGAGARRHHGRVRVAPFSPKCAIQCDSASWLCDSGPWYKMSFGQQPNSCLFSPALSPESMPFNPTLPACFLYRPFCKACWMMSPGVDRIRNRSRGARQLVSCSGSIPLLAASGSFLARPMLAYKQREGRGEKKLANRSQSRNMPQKRDVQLACAAAPRGDSVKAEMWTRGRRCCLTKPLYKSPTVGREGRWAIWHKK